MERMLLPAGLLIETVFEPGLRTLTMKLGEEDRYLAIFWSAEDDGDHHVYVWETAPEEGWLTRYDDMVEADQDLRGRHAIMPFATLEDAVEYEQALQRSIERRRPRLLRR